MDKKMIVMKFNVVKYFICTMSLRFTMKMIAVKDVIEKAHMSEPWPVLSIVVLLNAKYGMMKMIKE